MPALGVTGLYSSVEVQARIRELIKLAKEQGYLTFDDLKIPRRRPRRFPQEVQLSGRDLKVILKKSWQKGARL
jgi:hypothetical protein